MRLGTNLMLAALLSTAAVVGCDNKEETPATPRTPAPSPTATTPPPAGTTGDNTMNTLRNAAGDAKDKAGEMKNDAVDAMGNARTAAGDASNSLVTQAQQYYEQAKGFIQSRNFAGAEDIMGKLEGLKARLPAEWNSKIAELRTMLSNARTSAAPTTQPG